MEYLMHYGELNLSFIESLFKIYILDHKWDEGTNPYSAKHDYRISPRIVRRHV